MPNHATNGGVADATVALSAATPIDEPSARLDESAEAADAKSAAKEAAKAAKKAAKEEARKAEKQARKLARETEKAEREQEKLARAEAKAADKERKKANAKTEAAVAAKAEKARDEKPEVPAKGSRRLRFEGSMDREEVASYLESIAKGLRKGSLQFRQGEDAVELTPNERVQLGVKVASKGDAQRLTFDVEWDDETSPELSIVVS